LNGTLRVITVASPLAALIDRRASAIDDLDPNRIGLGKQTGQLSERLLNSLVELIQDSDLVVNLHEFEADSLLTCVYTHRPQLPRAKELVGALLSVGADAIWALEADSVPSFDDSLMKDLGIPTFSLELPRWDLVGEAMWNNALDGIMNLMGFFEILDAAPPDFRMPPVWQRTSTYAHEMGVWSPNLTLQAHVEVHSVVGEFANTLFESRNISATASGPILQIRPYQIVGANSILFAVGSGRLSQIEEYFRLQITASGLRIHP
jgi:predicted deacylase